jgi:hypothetical protein
MPTGANAYIFAAQYRRLVNPVSGAVALGTLLAAVTLPLVVWVVARWGVGGLESAPHHLPNIQSAQAQEREHHTNHDDESDQIDNSVHVSAPQRVRPAELQTPQVVKRFAVARRRFLLKSGNESERPCFAAG